MLGAPPDCGANETFDEEESMCCSKCGPGFGVVLPCTKESKNNTVCEACESGKFSGNYSHIDPCETCHICPPHAHQTSACTPERNTGCRCNNGFYQTSRTPPDAASHHHNRFLCQRCRSCKAGTFLVRPCDHKRNTLCDLCAPGHFSSVVNAKQCLPCKTCPFGSQIVQNCTATQDRQCSNNVMSVGGVGGSGRQETEAEADGVDSGMNLIPVYCALLGAVFVGLVIYVICKKIALVKNNKNGRSGEKPPQALCPVPNSAFSSSRNSWPTHSKLAWPSHLPMPESQVPLCTRWDVSGDGIGKPSDSSLKDLEYELNKLKDAWAPLARNLGIEDVSSVREEAALLGVNPSSRILDRWKMESGDVTRLTIALKASGLAHLTPLINVTVTL